MLYFLYFYHILYFLSQFVFENFDICENNIINVHISVFFGKVAKNISFFYCYLTFVW
jgi:hypothetical protein